MNESGRWQYLVKFWNSPNIVEGTTLEQQKVQIWVKKQQIWNPRNKKARSWTRYTKSNWKKTPRVQIWVNGSRSRTTTTCIRKKLHKVNKKPPTKEEKQPLQEERETSTSLSDPKGSIERGRRTFWKDKRKRRKKVKKKKGGGTAAMEATAPQLARFFFFSSWIGWEQ